MPTNRTVTLKSSAGDYTSMFSCEAAEQANLPALDRQLTIDCYAFEDTTSTEFTGWTTDATRFILIQAATGNRHAGAWTTSCYRLVTTSGSSSNCLSLRSPYMKVDGIQVHKNYNTANNGCIGAYDGHGGAPGAQKHEVINCIVRGTGSETNSGQRGITASLHGDLYARNNICFDFAGTNGSGIITVKTCYVYNNTIHSCNKGVWFFSGTGSILKNNLIRSCTTAASGTFAAGTDYNATDNASMGYTVTGGGNTHDRTSQTFTFVNEASDNFQITSADAGAKGHGVDLSADANLAFSDDVAGSTRSAPWDIGAFKYLAPAVIWAETVSFAVSAAAITPTPAVAASPSVTFSIVNALIAVFDGDGSTDLGGYLKQWLTWLPFPWRFFFKKP